MPPKNQGRVNRIRRARALQRAEELFRQMHAEDGDGENIDEENDEEHDEENDEEEPNIDEEEQRAMMMMMPRHAANQRAPANQPLRERGRNDPRLLRERDLEREQIEREVQMGARRVQRIPQAAQQRQIVALPQGNIRYGNGQLRAAVSWMFTLRLSNNPQRVNYFPFPATSAQVGVDDEGNYVRPYVVPTVDDLRLQQNAPVYIIYQLERGTNGAVGRNGLPLHGDGLHYQGYIEFGAKVTATQICNVMGWTPTNGWLMIDVWMEPRAGRREDAIAYVTKDETAVDIDPLLHDFVVGNIDGDEFAQGIDDQNRLLDQDPNAPLPPLVPLQPTSGEPRPPDAAELAVRVKEMIEEGATYHDILQAYPAYAMSKVSGINAAIEAIAENKGGLLAHRQVKTYVFWGDSRTGKSRKIAEMEGDENLVMNKNKVYVKNRKEQYYQHYKDQEVLVLDEFVGSADNKMDIHEFLMILDGQSYSLPIKYQSPRFARWTRVYITSNIPPRRWFPNADPAQIEAMYNRLKTGGIYKFVNTAKPVSVINHDNEVAMNLYEQDRPNVIMRDATAW